MQQAISTRAVEATVEHLQPLISQLVTDGISVSELSIALVTHAHLLASNAGEARACFNAHLAAMIETGDMFECEQCDRVLPASEGHADNGHQLCDDCYAQRSA